jgi:hypothetical protein
LTLGTAVFFRRLTFALDFTAVGREVLLLAVFAAFFCEAVGVRLAMGFLTRLMDPADLDAADLDVAGLEILRLDAFEAALFAFGRIDFV